MGTGEKKSLSYPRESLEMGTYPRESPGMGTGEKKMRSYPRESLEMGIERKNG